MALKMRYEDKNTKNVYENSVWIPLNILPVFSDGYGIVTFFGYPNQAVALLNMKKVLGIAGGEKTTPIGIKEYRVDEVKLREIAARTASGTFLTALSAVAYEIQASTNDVPGPTVDGVVTNVNFFKDATNVDLM